RGLGGRSPSLSRRAASARVWVAGGRPRRVPGQGSAGRGGGFRARGDQIAATGVLPSAPEFLDTELGPRAEQEAGISAG
ncbi:hypothetical protein ACFLWA_10510, partial [Chloroflexota bacterium]